MSHNKIRQDNICLNCGTTGLHDRYCPHCGQENVEPKQTLWHLITHFFNDITHFDGKFFLTLKLLITKPGFLSSEYVVGRRMKYLDPIRMYLFVSAIFLLVFLALVEGPEHINIKEKPGYAHAVDSLRKAGYSDRMEFYFDNVRTDGDTEYKEAFVYNLPESMRHGQQYYDSVNKVKPTKGLNWLDKFMIRKGISSYQAYDSDPYNFTARAVEGFFHSISKISFISLPVFASLLYLLYIRRRKSFYYVSHAIFSLHYYIVAFIIFLLYFGISHLTESIDWMDDLLSPALLIGLFAYLYIAMLRFYKQGWFKTLIKTTLQYSISLFIILILTLMLLVNSFINMGSH